MAYTTPTTQSSGTGLSSTAYNILVNDVVFFALKPFISARKAATQSVSNSTDTKVSWPTTDRATSITLGTDGVLASSRYTPTVAGWYKVVVNLSWSSSTTTSVKVAKNGADYAAGGGASSTYTNLTTEVLCNGSTDYLEIIAAQFSGGSINLAATLCRCTISWDRFDT